MPAAARISARHVALAWFAAAWLFHAVLVIGEVAHLTPDLNDDVLHLRLIDLVAETIANGGHPFDPWLSTIAQGFPLFHHYQHLPHLLLGSLSWLLGDSVSSLALLRGSQLVLWLAFPLSVAWSAWRLGDVVAGCFAGVAAILLASQGLYGFDPSSYGWAGIGLTTQLWASVVLGPAWVITREALAGRRSLMPAAALLAALIVIHPLFAYVTALSVAVMALAPQGARPLARLFRRARRAGAAGLLPAARGIGRRLLRLGIIVAAAAATVSYFLVPYLLDHHAMNRSVWEKASKYDSHGAFWALEALLSGELLDGSPAFRLPLLTGLVGVGLLLFVLQRPWRLPFARSRRTVVILFCFWLLLYFGRPTWGALLDLLPLSGDLHLHRLLAPLHLCTLWLVGLTAGPVWQILWARCSGRAARSVAVLLVTALFLQPFVERAGYHRRRAEWLARTEAAGARDAGDLERLLDALEQEPGGRAYAGRAPNWGGRYTIGAVPVYARLTARGIDNLGYLYHALSMSSDLQVYFDDSRAAHYALFDVRHLVAPASWRPPPFAREVARRGAHRLYQVETGGPFALARSGAIYAGSRAEWFSAARRWLRSSAVEAGVHPIFYVDRPGPPAARPMAPFDPLPQVPMGVASSPGRLEARSIGPGRLAATVRVEEDSLLLAKVTYHPNWQVTVNDEPREPLMVAPAFVGVALPAGSHRVVLQYAPHPARPVARWLGLAFCVTAWLFEARWRRRRPL